MNNSESMITDRLLRMQLADARKSKGLTQEQVSNISGLSKSCVSNIESGEDSSPTLRSLIKYADAIGVNLYISYNK